MKELRDETSEPCLEDRQDGSIPPTNRLSTSQFTEFIGIPLWATLNYLSTSFTETSLHDQFIPSTWNFYYGFLLLHVLVIFLIQTLFYYFPAKISKQHSIWLFNQAAWSSYTNVVMLPWIRHDVYSGGEGRVRACGVLLYQMLGMGGSGATLIWIWGVWGMVFGVDGREVGSDVESGLLERKEVGVEDQKEEDGAFLPSREAHFVHKTGDVKCYGTFQWHLSLGSQKAIAIDERPKGSG